MYRVTNPATGEVVAEYPTATDDEISGAVTAAATAYADWRRTPLDERIAVVKRLSRLLTERAQELGELIHVEMGKSRAAAVGEAGWVATICDYYAEISPQHLQDRPFEPRSGGRAIIQRRPLGPVLGIMPWNYPYYQVIRFAVPNLLLGNTILLKHAPQCPSSALALAKLFADAGLPEGCYVNLFASNEQVESIIADPRVAGVSLTGSERAGAAVAEIAGRHLKKVVLELGGSDAMLVLDAPDPAALAKTAYSSRMANTGQACNSPKRIIVVGAAYEPFLAALKELVEGSSDYAPLSSSAAADGVHGLVTAAVADGATLVAGGGREGAFVAPTLLTDVQAEMTIYAQEAFGPAFVVHQVADVAAAISLANDSPYGLGAVVMSSDETLALEVAEQLEVGMVYVNTPEDSEADLPFGGIKRSGFGRELGTYGLDEFANHKLIRLG